jgi:hypothetical protein
MNDDEKIGGIIGRPNRNDELMKKSADITLNPLIGWAWATLPQDNLVLLAIEYLTDTPTIDSRTLRFVMTRDRANELSKDLAQLARTPHVTAPEKPS